MNIVAVIPCRYESNRLPGKSLLSDTGKPLIQHVYENILNCSSLNRVIVATDDERIRDAARDFGAEAEMTSSKHLSGTDRVAEVASRIDGDIFVNVQGDEPELDPSHIDEAVETIVRDEACDVSTICSPLAERAEFDDPNAVKCVIDGKNYALYFSRSPIPYPRSGNKTGSPLDGILLKHHGVYCFRKDVLLKFPDLRPPDIEALEGLEQLRLLWHGYRIKVCTVGFVPKGIDTMEDYKAFLTRMK